MFYSYCNVASYMVISTYVPQYTATGSNYTCENSIEILVDMLCDGMNDCGDSSDENNSLCHGKLFS